MKNMFEDFYIGLKHWPVFRGVCIFGTLVTVAEVLIIAVIHQFSRSLPSVENFNLLIWQWHLPFSISRLWDIVLLPCFLYFSWKNEERRENAYFSPGVNDGSFSDDAMDLPQISLFGALVGGAVFGFIYAVPFFLLSYIMLILFFLVQGITESVCESRKGH